MSAAFYVCLVFWCLQTNAGPTPAVVSVSRKVNLQYTVAAELAPPENLTLITLNTNYTLSWDWDQSFAEGHAVNFTTQYVAKFKLKSKRKSPVWETACEKTSHRSCDLTKFNLYYLGIYVLRVQASVNGRVSDWMMKEFCPDKDAAVGPPSRVDLSPAGSGLDIIISDPLTSTNSSMKDHIPDLNYHILYWERSVDPQALEPQTLASKATVVTLSDLKAWTWYCVSVQSHYDFFNKKSSFTSPHCMQTEGAIPWWQILGYFLLSLVICFLLVLVIICSSFWFFKTVKATFYPSNQLPPHFQYLCDSSESDIPCLLTPDSNSELLCDKVTVCPKPPVLEIHIPPPEALPVPPSDSSGRHSRQGSGGSGDSGVYSTGCSSGLRQPDSIQSSSGDEDSGQGFLDLEQVKMKDMAPGLKTRLLITDEGVVDMCV
ncbi:interferon alpha/beta receptor 1b-like isoform X2 [Sander lucioperca]|uniref:interferon alpha/beta receptor 1b-like isoform X2 n=1 Tax=Sander lucioperca TaxID=283035 RepID=UPI00125E03E6|nr:interferon alpha/beta receptor 1b-like isoform X2 [Sander lucioperca]